MLKNQRVGEGSTDAITTHRAPTLFNSSIVQSAVQRSIPLSFAVDVASRSTFALLDMVLAIYLGEVGREEIQEPLSYCLKELVSNGQKASFKRIYFEEHGLDITNSQDYQNGMRGFLKDVSENLERYIHRFKYRRMSLVVTFHSSDGVLTISVQNNSSIAPMEMTRIKEKIVRARAFHSFFEILESIVDQIEGAGLGIMMLIQFLKRIGLGEEAFTINSEKGKTVASVVISIPKVHLNQIRVLTEFLVRDIQSLPHFPEAVLKLIRLTQDLNAKISEISSCIADDPTLTADLLKHANSSYYGLPSRVTSISQAVKLMGMRSLHMLMFSFGFQRLLSRHSSRMRDLLDHSLKTAFYAFVLARDFRKKREIVDDAYAAGILHHLGFIVLSSLHSTTQDKMRKFSKERNIPSRILERFSFGMNHAEVGALIAEKWNFPEQLVESIKYHHDPQLAGAKNKEIVYCVYLASAVCELEEGLVSYGDLDKAVLEHFGIESQGHLFAVSSILDRRFESRLVELDRLSPSVADQVAAR